MIQKRNVFIIIFSLLFVSTFGQLLVPEYFYSSCDEKEILNMQEEGISISIGPPTLDDILPKERDLSIFFDLLKKFEDTSDIILNPDASHTIFAPVNSALRKITRKLVHVNDLSEDPTDKLHIFTLGYIVPSAYSTLPNGEELKTLRNNTIKVKRNYFDGTYKLNGKAKTIKKLKAVNGFIYKIDDVLENLEED